jgi:hypothetical protein
MSILIGAYYACLDRMGYAGLRRESRESRESCRERSKVQAARRAKSQWVDESGEAAVWLLGGAGITSAFNSRLGDNGGKQRRRLQEALVGGFMRVNSV